MKLTPEQIDELASQAELKIVLPTNTTRKKLLSRYHLDIGSVGDCGCGAWEDEDGNPLDEPIHECECGDLFYNGDLRSYCGILADGWSYSDLILFPHYYADGWREDRWFARLTRDAIRISYNLGCTMTFGKHAEMRQVYQ